MEYDSPGLRRHFIVSLLGLLSVMIMKCPRLTELVCGTLVELELLGQRLNPGLSSSATGTAAKATNDPSGRQDISLAL